MVEMQTWKLDPSTDSGISAEVISRAVSHEGSILMRLVPEIMVAEQGSCAKDIESGLES